MADPALPPGWSVEETPSTSTATASTVSSVALPAGWKVEDSSTPALPPGWSVEPTEPTSGVIADTARRLGRAGVEGTLGGTAGILQFVKTIGDKLGLPSRGGDLVQNDNGLGFHVRPYKPGQAPLDKLRQVKQDLAAEYTKGGELTGAPIDPLRDAERGKWYQNLPALGADVAGSLAPALATGPLAPAVITSQIAENERAKAIAAGETPEMADARFQVALPVAAAMSVVAPFGGGTGSATLRKVATRTVTGGGAGFIGNLGLDVAENRPLDYGAAAKNAKLMAAFGALSAFGEKPANTTAETTPPPVAPGELKTPASLPPVELGNTAIPGDYKLPYGETGGTPTPADMVAAAKEAAAPAPAAPEPIETTFQTLKRAARQKQIEEAFNTQQPPSEAAHSAAQFDALKTDLANQEIAQNFKDIPEPVPAPEVAPETITNQPGSGALSTLGDLIGQDVNYAGYTGKLIRDAEGNFNVLRDIRLKGETPLIEIADTGKDPSTLASSVGVKPSKPIGPLSELKSPSTETVNPSQENATSTRNGIGPLSDLGQYQKANEGKLSTAPGSRDFTQQSREIQAQEKALSSTSTKAADSFALAGADPAMTPFVNNEQVLRSVIRLVPVDVMNVLGNGRLTASDFIRNPSMFIDALTANRDNLVSAGVRNALTDGVTALRAKLLDSLSRGRNEELLPALRTSDLTTGEVTRLLSGEGESTIPGGAPVGSSSAGARTKLGELASIRQNAEGGTTSLTDLLNSHEAIRSQEAGVSNSNLYDPAAALAEANTGNHPAGQRSAEISSGNGTPTPFEDQMMKAWASGEFESPVLNQWRAGQPEKLQTPEVQAALSGMRDAITREAEAISPQSEPRPAAPRGIMSKGNRGQAGFINLEPVEKVITYGMAMIKKGLTTFGEWADAMKGYFGDSIVPKLNSIWEAVSAQPKALFGKAEELVNHVERADDQRSDYSGTFKGKAGIIGETLNAVTTRIKRVAPELYGRLIRYESETKQNIAQLNEPFADFYTAAKKILSPQDEAVVGKAALDGDFEQIRELLKAKAIVDPQASAAALKAFDATQRVFSVLATEAKKVGAQFEELDNYWPRAIKPDKLKEFLDLLEKDQPGPFTKAYNEVLQKFQEENIKDGLAPAKELPPELAAQVANQVARGFKPGVRDSALSNNFKNRGLIKIPAEYEKYYLDWKQSAQDYVHRTVKLIEKRKFFGSTPELWNGSIGQIIEKLRFENRLTPEAEKEISTVLDARFGKGESGQMWAGLKKLKDINNITRLGQVGQAILNMDDPLRSVLGNGTMNTLKALFGKKEITLEDIGLESNLADFNNVDALSKWTKRIFDWSGLTKVTKVGQGSSLQAGLMNIRQQARSTGPSFALFRYKFEPIFGPERFNQLVQDLRSNKITTDVKTAALTKMTDLFPVVASQMPQGYLNHPNARALFYQAKSWLLSQMDMYRNMSLDHISNGVKMYNDPISTPRQKSLGQAMARQGYINLAKLTAMFVLGGGVTNEAKKFISGQDQSPIDDYLLDNLLYLVGGSKSSMQDIKKEGVATAIGQAALPSFSLVDRASRDIYNLFTGKPTFKSAASIPIIGGPLSGLLNDKKESKSGHTQRKR